MQRLANKVAIVTGGGGRMRMIPFRQSTSSIRSLATSEHLSPRSVMHLTIA